MPETVETAIYKLRVEGTDQVDRAAQSVDKLSAADDRRAAANDRVSVTQERSTRATRTSAESLDRWLGSLDKGVRATQVYEASLQRIARYEQEGVGSKAQLAQATELVTQRYQSHAVAMNDNVKTMGAVTASAGNVTYGMKQLGLQLGDIGTSLASGSSPLRVLAQQGDQVRIAIGQAGGLNAVLTAAGVAIGRLATPSNAAAIGLAAVGGGIAAVLSHAGQLETQAKQFTAALEAMGTTALANGTDFQKMVRELQEVGVAADDARAGLLQVTRTEGVNPAAARQIVLTGANIAASLGGDALQRATDYAKAIGGGTEKTLEFGVAVHALTAEQADLIRKSGDVATATKRIDDFYAGKLNTTLSSTKKLVDEVKGSVGAMWDALADSPATQAGLKALQHAADMMKALAEGKEVFLNLPVIGQMPLTAAAAKAQAAQQGVVAYAAIPPPPASAGAAGTASGGPAGPAPATNAPRQEQLDALKRYLDLVGELNKASRMVGESGIWWRAYWDAAGEGKKTLEEIWAAQAKANQAVEQHRIELQKTTETQRIANEGALKTASAYGRDVVSGLRAAAEAQGILNARAGQAGTANELLRTQASEAIKSLAEQTAAGQAEVLAQERLAAATAKGTAAAHDQELANQAITATQDALNKALATGDQALVQRVVRLRETTAEQLKAKDAAAQTTAAFADANQLNRQAQVGQLEVAMVGRAPEDITRAVSLLQAGQKLADNYASSAIAGAKAYADAAANLINVQHRLTQVREEQERTNRLFQGIASSIENTLGTAIDDIFAGKKITDWGTRLKSMFGQVQATIAKETLLKPILGTALSIVPGGAYGTLCEETEQ